MTDIRPVILILAGGEGRRMGGGKPHRLLAGRRLIDIAIARAASWFCPIAIQVRTADQIDITDLPIIEDKADIPGPLSGIIAGLELAKSQRATHMLSIACDMPFLPDDLLELLLTASIATTPHTIATATSQHQPHPVCSLWPVECLEYIRTETKQGHFSPKHTARDYGQSLVYWPNKPVDPLFNINTPEDLIQAEDWIKTGIANLPCASDCDPTKP